MSQTVFYARVSTMEQNLDHQITQAKSVGFMIDRIIADHGVSGVTTRLMDRPEGKRLFDILRHGDVLAVRWVDRLGRNYQDVTDTIRQLMRMGVVVKTVINKMTFDGSTQDPMQQAVRDTLIAFMSASAQAQVEVTKAAQRAGIDAAKANGTKYKGRKPSYDHDSLEKVIDLLGLSTRVSEIMKATGLSRQTILRIKSDPNEAQRILARWS